MVILDKIRGIKNNISEARLESATAKNNPKAIRIAGTKLTKIYKYVNRLNYLETKAKNENTGYIEENYIENKILNTINKMNATIKIVGNHKLKLNEEMKNSIERAIAKANETVSRLENDVLHITTDKYISNAAMRKAPSIDSSDELKKHLDKMSIGEENHAREEEPAPAMTGNAPVSNVSNDEKKESIPVENIGEKVDNPDLRAAWGKTFLEDLPEPSIDGYDDFKTPAIFDHSTENKQINNPDEEIVDTLERKNPVKVTPVRIENNKTFMNTGSSQEQKGKKVIPVRVKVKPNDKSVIGTDFREVPENSTIESKPLDLENTNKNPEKELAELLRKSRELNNSINAAKVQQKNIDQRQKEYNDKLQKFYQKVIQATTEQERELSEIKNDNETKEAEIEKDNKSLDQMMKEFDLNKNQTETKGKSL